MARASTYTHLSLDRFARTLGLAPPHFGGAQGGTVFPVFGQCRDVWPQHNWQTIEDLVSREELARAIHDAERDIRSVLGYSVAPEWETEEVHPWPAILGRQRIYPNTITTDWKRIITPGVRAVTLIDANADVTYSDPDGDGWSERATITVATTLTDPKEIKVHFAGEAGASIWEIRPVRSITISGGTATIVADSWLFIDPDLWEKLPTVDGFTAIDISTTANYVTTVDVYREYSNTILPSATLYWHRPNTGYYSPFCGNCGGSGCTICALTGQEGCFSIYSALDGVVIPAPATYDADSAVWTGISLTGGPPEQVKLNYKAGFLSKEYLSGRNLDPLDEHLAHAIVWLTVARLDRPICGCSNVQESIRELRVDATRMRAGESIFARFEKMQAFSNPFGTRVGEVKAWERIAYMTPELAGNATVL